MSQEPYEKPVVIVGIRLPIEELLLLTLQLIVIQVIIGSVVYIVLRLTGIV